MALTKINRGGLNTGVSDSSDATAITVDSSENIGIGNASPTGRLDIVGGSTYQPHLRITNSAGGGRVFGINVGVAAVSNGYFSIKDETADAYRLAISDSGKVALGTSTADGFLHIKNNYQSDIGMSMNDTSGSGGTAIRFKINGTTHGSIAYSGSGTSFNTSSDYRLKENVDYTFDATTRLKQLKPARFNFIADADTTVDGFLAHEVASIVPEAISGEKDATNEDGSIKPQGIDQAKLVPLLVKTIQEQQATIESLTARITALEGA